MLIDLHPTKRPLSHDSLITGDDLIVAAKQRGLDAVCLTEHDFFWDVDAARELSKRHEFPVIPGVELNTEDGHFVAFGRPLRATFRGYLGLAIRWRRGY